MTTNVAPSDMDELVRIERGAPEAVFGGNYGLVVRHKTVTTVLSLQ
jgi:hypothetical protein